MAAAARQLAEVAEVTVVTSASYRDEYERLRAAEGSAPAAGLGEAGLRRGAKRRGLGRLPVLHARVQRARRPGSAAGLPRSRPGRDRVLRLPGRGLRDRAGPRKPAIRGSSRPDSASGCTPRRTSAAVLDGQLADDFATIAIFDAERYVLSRADTVLWSGGDVLGTYERVYGPEALAPATKLPDAFFDETEGDGRGPDGPRRRARAAAALPRAPRTPQGSAEPAACGHGPRKPGRAA